MVNAQEYLDKIIPPEKRKGTRELDISGVEGNLDLSDFVNLKVLDCSSNKLTLLKIEKCEKLEIIDCSDNLIKADLSIFSHLTNLKKLDLGLRMVNHRTGQREPLESQIQPGKEYNDWILGNHFCQNNFSGSLKSLENCRNLEFLCIAMQKNISGGLEYLPTEKLRWFGCDWTEFEEQVKPYDFKISKWGLIFAKKRKITEIQKQITTLTTEKNELSAQLQTLTNEKSTLESTLIQEQAKNEFAPNEQSELKQKTSDLDLKLSNLQTQKNNLETELNTKITTFEKEKGNLEKNTKNLSENLAQEKEQHHRTNSQLRDLTTILFPSSADISNIPFSAVKTQAKEIMKRVKLGAELGAWLENEEDELKKSLKQELTKKAKKINQLENEIIKLKFQLEQSWGLKAKIKQT